MSISPLVSLMCLVVTRMYASHATSDETLSPPAGDPCLVWHDPLGSVESHGGTVLCYDACARNVM